MLDDPAAGSELANDGAIEVPPDIVVDVLDAGAADAELGLAEDAAEPLVLAIEPFGVDEQAEALVEGQTGGVGVSSLLGPGGGHGVELQGLELLDGRFLGDVSEKSIWIPQVTILKGMRLREWRVASLAIPTRRARLSSQCLG